ncbi:hypothetical protein EC991_004123 [Linnemannia zychae]|nr:hypothetical protein EC991_004123 [Linnemannia zychae]
MTTDMNNELQSFRQPQDGPTVQLRAEYDEDAGKHLIFWEDVEFAFPGVHCVKSGATIVSFARDKRRRRIEPLCIAYEPDVVLEVIMAATPSKPSVSTLSSPFPSPVSSTSTDTHYKDVTPPSIGRHALSDRPIIISPPLPSSSSFQPHRSLEQTVKITEISNSSADNIGYPSPSDWDDLTDNSIYLEEAPIQEQLLPPTRLHRPPPPIPPRPYARDKFYAPQPPAPSTVPALTTTTVETASNRAVTSGHFLQRMQSTVLSFEQSIRQGQIIQAKFLKQEADSIKQEMSVYYKGLHTEVAKNTTLQTQMLEMQAAADKMTKRILELQEAAMDTDKRMLEMQQKALDRLALIHSKASAILLQTYELHEYPIPRLFIILPKEDITRREKLATLFVKRFRLYFLCECGEHTKPGDGSESKLSHEIHLARHEGYDLDRPNEFVRKYGSYVLTLLQMLKYGVAAAGMVVSPLHSLKICEGLDDAEKGLKYLQGDIMPMVDDTIKYLEGLAAVQDGTTKLPEDHVGNASATTLVEPVVMNKLEALEGADLRHLGSFLKCKDEAKVLGNLYRTVTSDGHVKWVCLDHYRETYRESALREFRNNLEANNGQYDDRRGRVTIKLNSMLLAQQFYNILANTRFVQELLISLAWDTSIDDFRMLKNVIQKSLIYHLDIDACGFSGSTFDFVNRGRRWEPVLQMMGNGRLGVVAIRNMPGFLLRYGKIQSSLQIRVLDMSEQFVSTEEYPKLKKLLLASPNLSELSLLVPSICDGLDLVGQLTNDLKQLSTLLLKRQDGSTATVSYRRGSGEVANIELSICAYESHRIFQMPMVTALSIFGDAVQNVGSMRTALEVYRQLKTLELTCAPQDFFRMLSFVYQNINKGTSLGILTLRNAERDIIITGHNLPLIEIDFGAYVVPLKSFDAFGAFLSTCLQLVTLEFTTPSLIYGIELVLGISALRGTLRSLIVRQPNWSMADISFVTGVGEVESIELRICDVDSPKLQNLPCVKKVTIFSKDRSATTIMDRDFGYLLHGLYASYPDLQTIELLDVDSKTKDTAKAFIQATKDFSASLEPPLLDSVSEVQEVQIRRPSPRSLVDLPEEYGILINAFEAVKWITSMPLLISSGEVGTTPVNHPPLAAAPTFALKRYDGSLASVKIDLDTDLDSPFLLRICDYASDASFAPASATNLTIMLKRDTQLMELLIPAATKRCQGLITLAVVFSYQNMTYPSFLKILGVVHEAAIQRPTLRVFKDWGLIGSKRMATFHIPVIYMDATREDLSIGDKRILDQLLSSCPHLSKLELFVNSLPTSLSLALSILISYKQLSHFAIRYKDWTKVSFQIQPSSRAIESVVLQLPGEFSTRGTLSLDQRGEDEFYSRSTVITAGGGIMQLKDLNETQLQSFAAIQQLSNLVPGLSMCHVKYAYGGLQKTVAIPVLKVELPVSLSEERAYVLARILAYCPLLSEVTVLVDDLESAVIPFVKELPEQLKELSRLSVLQTNSKAMVSFFKQSHKSRKTTVTGQPQVDGVMIQTLTLPRTSALLSLPYVRGLTLLSCDPPDYTIAPSLQALEIGKMVATATKTFVELQSLDIKVKRSLFGSLKASLGALWNLGDGVQFDLRLSNDESGRRYFRGGSGAS